MSATVAQLRAALLKLRREPGCWCEVAIGNPNMKGRHAEYCAEFSALVERDGPANGDTAELGAMTVEAGRIVGFEVVITRADGGVVRYWFRA